MDDNIVDVQVSRFAMVVKRRTLMYSFTVVLVTMVAFLVFEKRFDENFVDLSRYEPDV